MKNNLETIRRDFIDNHDRQTILPDWKAIVVGLVEEIEELRKQLKMSHQKIREMMDD